MDGAGEISVETCLPFPPWSSGFGMHTWVICYARELLRIEARSEINW